MTEITETIPEEDDTGGTSEFDPHLAEPMLRFHKRQSFQKTMKRIASVPVMFLHDTVARPFLRHHSDSAPETVCGDHHLIYFLFFSLLFFARFNLPSICITDRLDF